MTNARRPADAAASAASGVGFGRPRATPLQWRVFSPQSRSARLRLRRTACPQGVIPEWIARRSRGARACGSRLSVAVLRPGTPRRRAPPSPISPRPSRSRRRSARHVTAPTATAPSRPIRTSPDRAPSISAGNCAHFKAGIRVNPIMQGMAQPLSDADMVALGMYFSQQKPKASRRRIRSSSRRARALYPRRRRRVRRCPPARPATRPTAPASRRTSRGVRPVRRLHVRAAQGVQGRRARQRPAARMPTAGSWRAIAQKHDDAQMKALADYAAGLR